MAIRARDLTSSDSGTEVTIEPMRRRHLRGVVRIESQVYPKPWSLGLYLGELSLRNSRIYLVARDSNSLVGYAGLMFSGPDGHITTVAVDPAEQRRGIARRLVLVLARLAVAGGAENLTLEVRMSNKGAQELYRHFGFAPAGVRKNYYAEVGEDALVMWANDVDDPRYLQRLDAIETSLPTPLLTNGFAEARP